MLISFAVNGTFLAIHGVLANTWYLCTDSYGYEVLTYEGTSAACTFTYVAVYSTWYVPSSAFRQHAVDQMAILKISTFSMKPRHKTAIAPHDGTAFIMQTIQPVYIQSLLKYLAFFHFVQDCTLYISSHCEVLTYAGFHCASSDGVFRRHFGRQRSTHASRSFLAHISHDGHMYMLSSPGQLQL